MTVLKRIGRTTSRFRKWHLTRDFYPSDLRVADAAEHYGVISYMPSANPPRYASLGDEFQSLAAAQFLPRVDGFVPRDNLATAFPRALRDQAKPLHLIMAARFFGRPAMWPPPANLRPTFVGFRLEPGKPQARGYVTPTGLAYLQAHAPIGCRDLDTCQFLEQLGVPTVLTGCITLTLRREDHWDAATASLRSVLAVNLPDDLISLLPEDLRHSVVRLSQELPASAPQTQAHRTAAARARLRELASASLVITTRLHAALPCVAFGTPGVLVDDGVDLHSRTTGMGELLPYLRRSDTGFVEAFRAFPWLAPPSAAAVAVDTRELLVRRTTELVAASLAAYRSRAL